MNIIIDTHLFLWLLNAPEKLKKKHITILQDIDNIIYFSSISIAEMMIKSSIGKLEIDFDIMKMIDSMDIKLLNFTGNDALYLGTLPFHHKDPFDRMIISQAIVNDFFIISVDDKFKNYECKLL